MKIITVSIPEDEHHEISRHYEKMGFELISSELVTCRTEAGVVTRTYYKNNYQFNCEQNNAEQLWETYKLHKSFLIRTSIWANSDHRKGLSQTIILRQPFWLGWICTGENRGVIRIN